MLVLTRRHRLVVLPCLALCLSVAGCSGNDADDAGGAADTTAVAVAETTVAAVPVDSTAAVASSDETAPEPILGVDSTSESPIARGTYAVLSDGFAFVVNEVEADATASLTTGAGALDAPAAGSHYARVNMTITLAEENLYDGPRSPGSALAISLEGDDAATYDNAIAPGAPRDALDVAEEIQPGGSLTGNLVFVVRDDPGRMVLRVYSAYAREGAWMAFA